MANAKGTAYNDDGINFGGAVRLMFQSRERTYERCIQAIVVDPDAGGGFVEVRPIPKRRLYSTTGERDVPRAKVKVRPMRLMHGGFVVDVPLFKGDTGYLVACDRDCAGGERANSAVLSEPDAGGKVNGGPAPVDSAGVSQFAFGFFIPCSWHVDGAGEFSKDDRFAGRLVIRSVGGLAVDGDGNATGDDVGALTVSRDGTVEAVAAGGKSRITMRPDGAISVSTEGALKFDAKRAEFSCVVDAAGFTKDGAPLTCPSNGQMI